MPISARRLITLVLAMTAVASAAAYSQVAVAPTPVTPVVLSGADIGFRVEGTINGVPAGRLVVRTRNGEWVEPRSVSSAGVIPLSVD